MYPMRDLTGDLIKELHELHDKTGSPHKIVAVDADRRVILTDRRWLCCWTQRTVVDSPELDDLRSDLPDDPYLVELATTSWAKVLCPDRGNYFPAHEVEPYEEEIKQGLVAIEAEPEPKRFRYDRNYWSMMLLPCDPYCHLYVYPMFLSDRIGDGTLIVVRKNRKVAAIAPIANAPDSSQQP